MSNEKTIQMWKNPVLRSQLENASMNHPSGDVSIEELTNIVGAGDVNGEAWNLSDWLGNKGYFCTITLECGCK